MAAASVPGASSGPIAAESHAVGHGTPAPEQVAPGIGSTTGGREPGTSRGQEVPMSDSTAGTTGTADTTARPARLDAHGVRDAGALAAAIAPLGLAMGVALGELAGPHLVSWLSAPLLLAGASQLVLFSQLDGGASVLAATGAALLVNSRFVVYGAALAPRFAGQPGWFRLLGPHYIVDQTYGLVAARFRDDPTRQEFRRYFMTASTLLWALWTASVGAGLLIGTALPESLPLEFVLSAMFVALVVPGIRARSEAWAAAAGVAVALAGAGTMPTLLGVVAAGGAVGALSGRARS